MKKGIIVKQIKQGNMQQMCKYVLAYWDHNSTVCVPLRLQWRERAESLKGVPPPPPPPPKGSWQCSQPLLLHLLEGGLLERHWGRGTVVAVRCPRNAGNSHQTAFLGLSGSRNYNYMPRAGSTTQSLQDQTASRLCLYLPQCNTVSV